MRKLLLFFTLHFLLCTLTLKAETIGEWQLYPSYWQSTHNIVAGNVVYALCEGNLISYDTEDTEVRTYSHLSGLSGVHISLLDYSPQAHRLILVYDDSNIDLMDEDGRVTNLSSLRDKSISGKNVNGLFIQGTTAWLATGFGFVEVDMQEGVFRNTYQMGFSVNDVALTDKYVYLATEEGVYSCVQTENMHETGRWTKIDDQPSRDIIPFDGKLMVRRSWCIFAMNEDGKGSTLSSGNFDYLRLSDSMLIWGNAQKIETASSSARAETLQADNDWQDVSYSNGLYWVSRGEQGLFGYKVNDKELTLAAGPIQPNSPKHDLFYRMQWVGDRLLVAGGINTIAATYNPPTAMLYEDRKWTNLQEMQEYPEAYTRFNHANTTHLVQDPNDPSHHFASLHRNGLCEYRDGKFVKLYNCDNSPIRSILPDVERYYNYVSCAGLQYDADGNLWMLNSETDTIVRVLKADGKWASLFYSEIAGVSLCDDYLIHSSGLMFLNSRRIDNRGFFGFDTKGTLGSVRDDRHRLHSIITNQDGTTYTPDEFYCMTEDLDGRIWCGTDRGLFVINDAEEFFQEDFRFEQVKIPRNDGSGLADYLLNGVAVSCITVDGANRKWIGTIGNGIYLVSADGTEMIHHFMSTDSPLPDNSVQCIAVHPTTGLVMIGTEAGLCSYVSDATEAAQELNFKDVHVYPNPVRPDYTGPIAVKGLPMNAEVKILSSSGQLVWTGTSQGGTFTWNGCNRQGRRVASGIYHIVANNAQGKKAIVARLIMIR